jgi:hypothetical protein
MDRSYCKMEIASGCQILQPEASSQGHSLRKDFTGFARAALIV